MTHFDDDMSLGLLRTELLKRRLNFFLRERTKFRNALVDILHDLNAYAGEQSALDPIQSIARHLSDELENHIDFTAEIIAEYSAESREEASAYEMEDTAIIKMSLHS